MRLALGTVALLVVLGSPPALGQGPSQDWVSAVLPDRSFDFGTVARGSKVHHSFKLMNTTSQEIHILANRPKCGCTQVTLGAQTIPPGTQTVIEAVVDTTKFTGPKASGLTLIIDRPQYVEVDLALNCFIRGDLTLNPGVAEFGTVSRSARTPTVSMALAYAGGQPDWAITRMQTRSAHITARLSEGPRSAGSGVVGYNLEVTLNPTAPTGFLQDEITLQTNDPSGPAIPISVTANVQSDVSVTPTVVTLGRVRPGESVKKTILVRSARPFKLAGVRSSQADLTFAPAGDEAKPLHAVAMTFTAPSQPGPFHAVVEIETDVKDEPPAKINAFATVVP